MLKLMSMSSRGSDPIEFELPYEDLEIRDLPLRCYRIPGGRVDPSRALVCIPGFSASGRSFARLAPLAQEFDIRMVTSPLERPLPGDPADTLADVIAEYASQFDSPILLGTSFGGLVAITVASRLKGAVSGLVLTAAFANGSRLAPAWLPLFQSVLPALQLAAAPLAPITARVVGGISIDRPGRQMIIEDTRLIGASERARRLQAIFSSNLLPLLPDIRVPAIVIHGTADRLVPARRAKETAAALPDCSYYEIRGAGHLPYVTHSREFLAILRPFLERVTSAAAA